METSHYDGRYKQLKLGQKMKVFDFGHVFYGNIRDVIIDNSSTYWVQGSYSKDTDAQVHFSNQRFFSFPKPMTFHLLFKYFHFSHVSLDCSLWEPSEAMKTHKLDTFLKHFNSAHPSDSVVLKSGRQCLLEWVDTR